MRSQNLPHSETRPTIRVTDDFNWILLDTETTGFARPVFAVDIAAQKMRGWEKDGVPFRRMINHGCEISDEASRVHGYTREILERDGGLPAEVYGEFEAYAGGLPMVAYNLQYDWNQVLLPEWKRLGIRQIGIPGFCALKLAQRLLDPVPAGNCKLQTLRQYYRLPENGAHTALGDVLTVIDLMQQVLRPLAEKRGLDTWEKIVGFAGDEWFPSRLSFGKFKGRLYQEAREDAELRAWLEWLAESTNAKSSAMGRWYLGQLKNGCGIEDAAFLDLQIQEDADGTSVAGGLVVFQQPEMELYQRLVEASRNRLAELELEYGIEKSKVDSVRSRLFGALRATYQERDRLRLLVQFRKAFIERLLAEGEEAADATASDYQRDSAEKDREYESTASALEGKRELNDDEAIRLKQLWKKLVRMFHPDLHEQDPEKRKTYEMLTQAINEARDRGDIELLERIVKDPQAFILSQGWTTVSLDPERGLVELRSLYQHLQTRILEMIETLDALRASAEMEIFREVELDENVIDRIAAAQREELEGEIAGLKIEADRVAEEARELAGEVPF
jgi:DNA polymerase III epsilon subunit-like protein